MGLVGLAGSGMLLELLMPLEELDGGACEEAGGLVDLWSDGVLLLFWELLLVELAATLLERALLLLLLGTLAMSAAPMLDWPKGLGMLLLELGKLDASVGVSEPSRAPGGGLWSTPGAIWGKLPGCN